MASLPQSAAFGMRMPPRRPSTPSDGPVAVWIAQEQAEMRRRATSMARLVEAEIIPRLMLSHRGDAARAPAGDLGQIPEHSESVRRIATLAGVSAHEALMTEVSAIAVSGVSLEDVFLRYLAPAARLLGDDWLDDRLSFGDVTVGLGALQHLVRTLSRHIAHAPAPGDCPRSVLLAAAPGEQHTFGLVIIDELFRRAGWRSQLSLSGDVRDLCHTVASEHIDIFGVSISDRALLAPTKRVVRAVREASSNRDIVVLAGGRIIAERPELAAEASADLATIDAQDAILKAEGAVRQLARR
jgi:methanogenic corrinoid protein MtbC1